ncbi:uncharacterized protein LOC143188340 [Calliopsis andreniformis]|uniref:uncharacterized protein LOC143188340 n=1 Tax=Calliopsis andreniformis TaxID=337506 RepID=UPI003FCC5877
MTHTLFLIHSVAIGGFERFEQSVNNVSVGFVTSLGNDFNTTLECLPPIMTALVVMAKYLNGVFQVKKLKEVCYMIKSDTERLMNLPEYEVLHEHAMAGRKFSIFFIAALHFLLVIYLILPTVLTVNDALTKNDTKDRYMMYPGHYIIWHKEDCYYVMVVHCYLASILILTFISPLDTMYITFTQHACAMFAVVGHRLKTLHILDENSLRLELDCSKNEKLLLDKQEQMYAKLILCIKEHKRALECTQIVQSAFSVTLFVQIMLNIILLSITGIQALYKLVEGSLLDVIRLATWMMGQHIHLFFLYLPGQRLFDFSTQVYYDALECMWYKCFKRSRVIYQIMVMNTLTPVKLTALKVTPLNMEAFLSVTQAAVSYFTVLSSTI